MSIPPSSGEPSLLNPLSDSPVPLPRESEVIVVPELDDLAAGLDEETGRTSRVTALRSGVIGAGRLVRARWARLDFNDRAALGMWGAAHLALLVVGWAAAWVYRTDPSHAPLTGVYQHWDANILQNIAQYGYFSPQSSPNSIVMFPGFPVMLAGVHLILRNWVLSELVISGVAGCFAVVSLSRLAGSRRAVLYLLAMPAAVFLMVGYAECLFLALAIPAWHAATRGWWGRAALLAGLAGLVRVDAVFLDVALVVMALTGARGSRIVNAAKVYLALAGPAVYALYLIARTGYWNAWTKAEQAGWDLHTVTPLQALKTTYWAAFQHPFNAADAFEFQIELAAMAVMLLATLVFLCCRRWPEAVYCGLPMLAIGTQTWYQTGPRTVLVLFPICVGLASLEIRHPWVRYVYLTVSAPLAVIVGLLYLSLQWTG